MENSEKNQKSKKCRKKHFLNKSFQDQILKMQNQPFQSAPEAAVSQSPNGASHLPKHSIVGVEATAHFHSAAIGKFAKKREKLKIL